MSDASTNETELVNREGEAFWFIDSLTKERR